ncbi:IS110 family transposase [Novosphingobium sp. Gsoil 351]|uniref:IS110 family transposase n=1 Tax=Novosphingobium sp. Gsoil 351 TaxID=2675225 RepID=UPI0012B44C98|nr:IS110 family transposase [Novosphingobium sp. Gsoil 351]QGN55718.1 IS110 family transposase [Novosphingobium sp. Gsoil 351]
MEQYIGLDVSMKETAIAIRQDGRRIWRGKCASDPHLLAEVIRKRAPHVHRVVFETGPLSVWFYHTLTTEGIPAGCIDARHAKAALDMAPNKTDANDADGLAHLAEAGFYREVRVKGFDSMLIRTLVNVRRQLLKMRMQISNQIRGVMKTFGLVVPKGAGSVFERNVRTLLEDEEKLAHIVLPMLQAWRDIRVRAAELNSHLVALAREDQRCRQLMSVPGVGTVTATAFVAAVEDPANFKNSRSVGAWIGLTPRRYQSGEVDYEGHISRRGDNQMRHLLFEAAAVILNRTRDTSSLRTWALELKERLGFKRAAVALARKLAVVMHSMLKTGELFDPRAGRSPQADPVDAFCDHASS